MSIKEMFRWWIVVPVIVTLLYFLGRPIFEHTYEVVMQYWSI